MKTSKLLTFPAAFVLLALFSVGAMAQRTIKSEGTSFWLPPRPIVSVVQVDGIEVTDGTVGVNTLTTVDTLFGYTFLGQTTGDLPGSFTLSMNCTPAVAVPDGNNDVAGGSWTLPVYMSSARGNNYAGSLYGTVTGGSMRWDSTGTGAYVNIVLQIDGGTQYWNGATGYATFVGNVFVDEQTQKTMLNGEIVFNTFGGDGVVK